MVDSDYLKVLDYFGSNNISLNEQELCALQNKVLGDEAIITVSEALDILATDTGFDVVQESSNTVAAAKELNYIKKIYKAKVKELKINIKNKKYPEAKKNINEINDVLTKTENYIKSLDLSSNKEFIIGAVLSFAANAGKILLACLIGLSLGGTYVSAEIGKEGVRTGKIPIRSTDKGNIVDIMDIANYTAKDPGMKNYIKGASVYTASASYLSNAKTIFQTLKQYQEAKKKGDKKAIGNSLNLYRTVSLNAIKSMKKELARFDQKLSKVMKAGK